MNKLLIVFVVLGLALAQNAFDQSKVQHLVNDLKKSDYGRNILTTIQLELASGTEESAVKRISAMLQELLDQINSELVDLTATRGRKSGDCQGRTEEVQNTIARLTVNISEDESKIPPIEENRDQKDKDKKMKDDELNILRDDLRQVEEQNEEERQIYFQTREDHDNLIAELNKAKKIVSDLQKGAFLQKKEKQVVLAQLQDHATEAVKKISADHQKTIFSFVMNMAQQVGVQADQDLVKKVVNIIDELIAEEEYAKQVEFEAENIRLQRYDFDKHRKVAGIEDLEAQIKQLVADIKAYNLRLVEIKSDITSSKGSLDSKGAELEQTQDTCTDTLHSMDTQIKAYNNEHEIITEALKLMSSQAVKEIDRELSA